jgi:23S rRNA (adenine2503-C2)-methyltransferase
MTPLLGKTLDELLLIAQEARCPRFVGKQLAHWLYVKRACAFSEMTNLPLRFRQWLSEHYAVGRTAPVAQAVSEDGTCKYLFQVQSDKGKAYVETVWLPENDRATLCVSTQAGCRMGCKFCMTGTLGFMQHLTAADILNQIFSVDALHGGSLTNIVYMGEGEPLDNIDEVLRSIQTMTADYGCAWSPHRITVSTVGFLPNLKRFLDSCDCHLAVSLHNPFPEQRSELMPAERAWHITDVLELLREYDFSRQRRLSFEYICFGGINDTMPYAKQMSRLLHNLPCRVNLIRFHTDGDNSSMPPSDEQRMVALRDWLTAHGITTTIRKSRGEDILAACGMLVNQLKNEL